MRESHEALDREGTRNSLRGMLDNLKGLMNDYPTLVRQVDHELDHFTSPNTSLQVQREFDYSLLCSFAEFQAKLMAITNVGLKIQSSLHPFFQSEFEVDSEEHVTFSHGSPRVGATVAQSPCSTASSPPTPPLTPVDSTSMYIDSNPPPSLCRRNKSPEFGVNKERRYRRHGHGRIKSLSKPDIYAHLFGENLFALGSEITWDELCKFGWFGYHKIVDRTFSTLYQNLADDGFYIYQCPEHGMHFNQDPERSAMAHAKKHKEEMGGDTSYEACTIRFGVRIVGCDKEKMARNNENFEDALRNGYKPLGMRMRNTGKPEVQRDVYRVAPEPVRRRSEPTRGERLPGIDSILGTLAWRKRSSSQVNLPKEARELGDRCVWAKMEWGSP